MATLFTRIIKGEVPCHKVAEDEHYLAFLDIRPVRLGHTLVIPKNEVNYIFDIEDASLAELMVFAKKIALALGKAVPCKRVGVMVAGLEVPHAHIHLIPIQAVTDLNFANAQPADHEALAQAAQKIRSYL